MKLSESIQVGCYNCVRRSNRMKFGRKHQNRTYILNRWCQQNRMRTYGNRIKADEEHKPFTRLPLN